MYLNSVLSLSCAKGRGSVETFEILHFDSIYDNRYFIAQLASLYAECVSFLKEKIHSHLVVISTVDL